MRFLKVKEDLFVVEQKITKEKVIQKDTVLNHILMYDRSYSMSFELKNLTEDIASRCEQLPVGDIVTLGWFSGEGQFNFILKGFKISEKKDYKALRDTIKNNKSPVGCTCFSEILSETEQVLKDISIFSNCFALTFFTDGYPVVRDYQREIGNIKSAIKKISGKINSSLFVGYGSYYNKELMSEMAETMGGSFCHASHLKDFQVSLGEFIEDSREACPKIEVDLEYPSDKGVTFSINGKSVNMLQDDGGKVLFTPTKKANDFVYTLVSKKPDNALDMMIRDVRNMNGKSAKESIVKAAYAAAYILTSKTKTDQALDILSILGDKAVIDAVNNAFTNSEYGKAEELMRTCMAMPSRRCKSGRDTDYVPKEDAFSLLDLIFLLQKDSEAYFYPRHGYFVYSRVGAASKQVDEGVKFEANKNTKCSVSNLTWNDKKLNLSVLAKIDGDVHFKDGYRSAGFNAIFPSHVWRNYTIVKDGALNVSVLPCSLSEKTFNILISEGVIGEEFEYGASEVYPIMLDKVPVVNRSAANGKTSATELCKRLIQEWELKGELKALKALKTQNVPESKQGNTFDAFNEPQRAFLEANYITKNGFSPKVEKIEPKDFYNAKVFNIKLKGCTSLPKVEAVQEKIKKDKPLKFNDTLIVRGLTLWDKSGVKTKRDYDRSLWFDLTIAKKNNELIDIRRYIQETKFSIILGKKWFDEFQSREENNITVDGHIFTIDVGETLVKF